MSALRFAMEGPPPKMPGRNTVRVKMEGALALRQADPAEFYTDLKKVGAGASGTVYSATQKLSGQKVALK